MQLHTHRHRGPPRCPECDAPLTSDEASAGAGTQNPLCSDCRNLLPVISHKLSRYKIVSKRNYLFSAALILLALSLALFSQTSSQFPELDKNGKPLQPRPMPHFVYSPADLAHNAVTLPAAIGGATPNTNIIRLGAVTKMTVFANCTQNFDLVMNVYTADDQSQSSPNFTLYNSYVVATAMQAGAQQAFLASELAPNVTSGTLGATVRLPQLAVSFFEKNDVATAGTCTDRVIVGY